MSTSDGLDRRGSKCLDAALFQSVIDDFAYRLDNAGNHLAMDSIIVSQGERYLRHEFTSISGLYDLRSLSKPILGAALGVAMDRGLTLGGELATLDMKIWPFFENKVRLTNTGNLTRLRKITLKHVLTHTMGFSVGLMFSKDVKGRPSDSLLDYIFNANLDFEPGEHFVYSNAGPYVISALIQETLGKGIDSWVGELLFQRLGIEDYQWKRYGEYCAGCSGLMLSNGDLHKIARLFADDGLVHGEQIVPKYWIDCMRTAQVLTPSMYDERRVFPKYAYGFYLWICEDGRYYCDGTDGQYLIVLPNSGIAITTVGHQPDMKPITECLRALI